MLEVEDWTQPAQHSKRKVSGRKPSNDREPKEFPLANSPPILPPGPSQTEVEDSFRVSRPSHLFPTRSRSNSSPTARPSSLSRLLAQAPVESPAEIIPQPKSKTPSPTTSPPPPPSPSHHTGSAPRLASPLRPGSRSSKISTSSRFSVGRIPPTTGGVKAAATIALSEQPLSSSPLSEGSNAYNSAATPSPDGSILDGMTNIIHSNRRRTTSYHISRTPLAATSSTSSNTGTYVTANMGEPVRPGPTTTTSASSALANLANSWGVAFGRRKKTELADPVAAVVESSADASHRDSSTVEPSASDLLKRF